MKSNVCPVCGGNKFESETSFTVDYKTGVVVVRNVPATVCSQCGEEWLSNEVTEKLEKIVNEAKKQKLEIYIKKFKDYSLAS